MKVQVQKVQPTNWEVMPELSFQTAQTVGDFGYLFGGCEDAPEEPVVFSADMYSYDFAHNKWAKLRTSGNAPSPRALSCSAVVDDCMFVFGGYDITAEGQFRCFNGMYCFDTVEGTWSTVDCCGDVPAPRAGASMCAHGTKLYLFGGSQGCEGFFKDLYVFDIETSRWRLLSGIESPLLPRCGTSLACAQDRLFIFGGWAQKEKAAAASTTSSSSSAAAPRAKQKATNDLHVFDLGLEEWVKVKTKGSTPTPRTGHCCISMGSSFYIICGGVTSKHPRKSVHKFDAIKNKWHRVAKLPHCIGCSAFVHPQNPQIFLWGGRGFRTEIIKGAFLSNIFVMTVAEERRAIRSRSFSRLVQSATPVKERAPSSSAAVRSPEMVVHSPVPMRVAGNAASSSPSVDAQVDTNPRSLACLFFDEELEGEQQVEEKVKVEKEGEAAAGKENGADATPFDSPGPGAHTQPSKQFSAGADPFDEVFGGAQLRGVAGRSPLVRVDGNSAAARRQAVRQAMFSTGGDPFSP